MISFADWQQTEIVAFLQEILREVTRLICVLILSICAAYRPNYPTICRKVDFNIEYCMQFGLLWFLASFSPCTPHHIRGVGDL